ncbi:DMT family transporter [Paenibacillus thiaminolyticus]|uniref:DMT family transporter n=1 Tax=Paenibacillus thiaminolyticus TaxID=49283 RepID=UPI0025438000|nr:DMT family transporter [Paenibacillus thiaminolyticus]WII39452.1 DMT family transporter [Paenibacillus thiaminolyticus]
MNRTRLSELCLLITALIWGSTFLIVQRALDDVSSLAFNAARFAGAALLFLLMMLASGRLRRSRWDAGLLLHGSVLGLWLFGAFSLQTAGLQYTTSTNTGFITGMSVVFVPFASLLIAKQRLSAATWMAAGAAFAGLYLLAVDGGGSLSLNQGDILVFFGAVCFALHIAVTALYAPRHETMPLVTVQFATVGVLAALLSGLTETAAPLGERLAGFAKPEVLIALLVSVLLSTGFAYWAQTWCQQHTSAARVAIIFATEPVFAALTGVIFAGERLGWSAVLGCALILGGMLYAELADRRPADAPPQREPDEPPPGEDRSPRQGSGRRSS